MHGVPAVPVSETLSQVAAIVGAILLIHGIVKLYRAKSNSR